MGKSVVDLPDPLEHGGPEPLTTAAPAGVDDLLAQMAGDEIDRLLAEADNPREVPAERPAPVKPVVAPAPVTVVTETPAAPPAENLPAAAPDEEEEGATTAAERSALQIPETVEAPVQEEALFTEEETSASIADDGALPFYLKPLEWLNAPLEALPEGIRDAVGKIALLTLFNAVAVLIYVLMFRRHR